MKNNSRSILSNILISFVIFLFFIFILEIVLRTTHLFGARISWSEPDQIVGWRFVPNSKFWLYKENDHPVTEKINSYGWRDKERALVKPPNTYRIAVLGDSMVESFQVESNRTFLELTECELKKNNRLSVEVMNFGQSEFTQTEEFLVLKNHVEKFSPDMVIVFFQPFNDIRDVNKETAAVHLHPFYTISENGELLLDTNFVKTREFKNKCLISKFKLHSIIISLIAERYAFYKDMKAIQKNNDAKTPTSKGYLSLCTSTPDAIYERNYQLNKTLIKAMVDRCRGKGIRFMLITVDTCVYIPEIEERYKSMNPSFNANYFEDDLKDFAESLKIDYIGLQRLFRQEYENTKAPLHWAHWNYEGHKLVADILSKKLKTILSPGNDNY